MLSQRNREHPVCVHAVVLATGRDDVSEDMLRRVVVPRADQVCGSPVQRVFLLDESWRDSTKHRVRGLPTSLGVQHLDEGFGGKAGVRLEP